MSIDERVQPAGTTSRGVSLRLPAVLLLGGQLLYILVTQFHTGGHANDHHEIFAKYAASDSWEGVHVGQFLAMALIVAGLVTMSATLELAGRGAATTARLGVVASVVALALYAGLQAVDGIGNKQVDDAWVNASPEHKAASFASADAMRWLEWGMRSYHDYALGLALLLLAASAIAAATVAVPRAAAVLMALSGLAYLAQGWVVGVEGFSGTHTVLILVAWAFGLAWMTWLAVGAWRMPRTDRRSTS